MTYLYDGVSEKNGRPSNMDSLLVTERRIMKRRALLALVCDGVGSLSRGGFASAYTARELEKWFHALEEIEDAGRRLRGEVQRINDEVIKLSKEHNFQTGTTLSALLVVEDVFVIVHVGDSRIYRYQSNVWHQMTRDDTVREKAGEEAPNPGALTACIGITQPLPLFYCDGEVHTPDLFLVCSDGFYRRFDFSGWEPGDEPLRRAVRGMVETVAAKGETDNISLALVKITE